MRLGVRGSSPLGGLFWLKGSIVEGGEGTEVHWRRQIDPLAAAFWGLWTLLLSMALGFMFMFRTHSQTSGPS